MHAMMQMLPQQIGLDARQSCAHCLDLGDDVDAIPVVLDHFRDAANLAFDALQGGGRLLVDAGFQWVPPWGN